MTSQDVILGSGIDLNRFPAHGDYRCPHGHTTVIDSKSTPMNTDYMGQYPKCPDCRRLMVPYRPGSARTIWTEYNWLPGTYRCIAGHYKRASTTGDLNVDQNTSLIVCGECGRMMERWTPLLTFTPTVAQALKKGTRLVRLFATGKVDRRTDGYARDWRVTSDAHTWKTRPHKVEVYVANGQYNFSYFTQNTCHYWTTRAHFDDMVTRGLILERDRAPR